jgi:hypothetical protein
MKNHVFFEALAKMFLFSYDTVNNICTQKAHFVPARRTGACNKTTMNRINATDEFVNYSQLET